MHSAKYAGRNACSPRVGLTAFASQHPCRNLSAGAAMLKAERRPMRPMRQILAALLAAGR